MGKKTKSETVYLPYGRHIVVDMSGCDARELNDMKYLEDVLISAASATNMTIIDRVRKQFDPDGVSVILLLIESHISIHTYPRFGVAMLDIFTCGEKDAWPAVQVFAEMIRHEFIIANEMSRGVG